MPSAAVVTASDTRRGGDDRSGPAVTELLRGAGIDVVTTAIVPDDRDEIARLLRRLADDEGVDLVVVTGGTGLSVRDVTPEAVGDVVDRQVPGLGEAMRAAGRAVTPLADLSRSVAGIRGRTLIVAVPGSVKGAGESIGAILDLLPHALEVLTEDHGQYAVHHGDAASHGQATHGDDHVHHHEHDHEHEHDEACALAHGDGSVERDWCLVALSASPVALWLLHWGRELGFTTVLVEPDTRRVTDEHRRHADRVVATIEDAAPDATTDVVATDHDVAELADLLAATLRTDARWIGLMGSKRHTAPHVEPLRERGFDEDAISRIHRPIGLDIGSRTPPEIALATLAGLIADRNGRPGVPAG